jgi:hypothetical protein
MTKSSYGVGPIRKSLASTHHTSCWLARSGGPVLCAPLVGCVSVVRGSQAQRLRMAKFCTCIEQVLSSHPGRDTNSDFPQYSGHNGELHNPFQFINDTAIFICHYLLLLAGLDTVLRCLLYRDEVPSSE